MKVSLPKSSLKSQNSQIKSRWEPQNRRLFITSLCGASLFLIISFWLNAAWIYGSLYREEYRAKNLEILVIDLDGGDIGQVISDGAASISGTTGVATFKLATDIDVESAYNKVWRGDVWGALIAMPNATFRLNSAVDTGNTSYNPSDAVLYIWNEARWALVQESVVETSIEAAVIQAQMLYSQKYTSRRVAASRLSPNSALVLLNPFQAKPDGIYSFSIGIKPFISTVGFVFPGLIQFFFAMGLRGISAKTDIHRRLSTSRNYLIRFLVSRLFAYITAVCWVGWFYTFAEGRTGSSSSYILMTLNIWMYTMIAFEYHDACATFAPVEILPITVLSWVIINVTAAAFPIPLKPTFYRIDYALPSLNCFEIFITILTGGSTNRLYRNLPVLFVWMIVTGAIGVAANMRRCRLAQARMRDDDVLEKPKDEENNESIASLQEENNVQGESSHEAQED